MDFSAVKSIAIYPAIGIARVGNSPHEYLLGPQIPGQHPSDANCFRDTEGRIKRQASQFYIYGLDENGKILGEIKINQATQINQATHVKALSHRSSG